jgi:hypothetical protein
VTWSVLQGDILASLSDKAGIELPQVRSKKQASDALDRLQGFLTQPALEGFSASTTSASEGSL